MYQTSKYNYFVPYRNKIIYYNSLRRSSFAMTLAEHQKIRKLFEDPISFSLEFPSVFTQFYNWGFSRILTPMKKRFSGIYTTGILFLTAIIIWF